jgi:Cu-Zn family superoxide dismutase
MPRSLLPLILTLAACGGSTPPAQAPFPEGVTLRDAGGSEVGVVALRSVGDRLEVQVRVNGFPPGIHAMHLHEIGRCQAPTFRSAGPHFNPGGTKRHGRRNPLGHHQGDLGNLSVGPDGNGERIASIGLPRATGGAAMVIGGLGRSLVVHANADDELSQPDGKSGPRIACAELNH